MEYELYGIGNPVMDILTMVSQEDLEKHSLRKGTFNLISADKLKEVHDSVSNTSLVPGGSVANSVALFSQLGGKAFFCGKVGDDETAKNYKDEMSKIGVDTHLAACEMMTATNINLITPDSERTMAVHLGAALTLKKEDIDIDRIKKSRIMHVGAYVLEDPSLRDAVEHALVVAKDKGLKISVDCADPALVERCREHIYRIIIDYADIIFANEEEARALTGIEDPQLACEELSKHCEIAVVKLGRNGSLVRKGEEVYCVDSFKVSARDTTGAGDAYAGAFLYGIVKGYDLETTGKLASFMAAKVVETLGARLSELPDLKHIIQ